MAFPAFPPERSKGRVSATTLTLPEADPTSRLAFTVGTMSTSTVNFRLAGNQEWEDVVSAIMALATVRTFEAVLTPSTVASVTTAPVVSTTHPAI